MLPLETKLTRKFAADLSVSLQIFLNGKSGRKRKRNNQDDKYKYFISQALYTNNFNSGSIRNKNLMNELFLDRNRFHF